MLVYLDSVANLLQPLRDRTFGDRFTQGGHDDLFAAATTGWGSCRRLFGGSLLLLCWLLGSGCFLGRFCLGRCFFLGWLFLRDRKSTRLNSSHVAISYAVFCLTKK